MPTKYRVQTGLYTPKNSTLTFVRMRVSAQGRIDLYTGITIQPKQWSEAKQRVKQGCVVNGYPFNILNEMLDKQEQFVRDYFALAATRSVEPSLQDLKSRFNKKFKIGEAAKAEEFFIAFEQFRQQQEKARAWKKDMVDVFARLQKSVETFKPDMKFSDLSVKTMDAFMTHLSKTMYNDTILKNLSYFRQFIVWAQKRNYPIHEEYFTFEPRLQTAKKQVRFLTKEELDTIYNLKLDDEQLERTRDFFVFQCYTALRYSDLKQLKHDNIHKRANGDYYIDLVTEKDEDRVSYKLASRAVEIYNKYKDYLLDDNLVFPVLSNQKYNDHLKDVGKEAKLQGEWLDYEYRLDQKEIIRTPKEDLSTHTARRTFVSLAYAAGSTLDEIAAITSHSDVSKMKPYLKVLPGATDKVIDALDGKTPKKRGRPRKTKS